MKPNAEKHHNPDPGYLRELIESLDPPLSQRAISERLGIGDRTLRQYLAGDRPIPYSIQYACEKLVK